MTTDAFFDGVQAEDKQKVIELAGSVISTFSNQEDDDTIAAALVHFAYGCKTIGLDTASCEALLGSMGLESSDKMLPVLDNIYSALDKEELT